MKTAQIIRVVLMVGGAMCSAVGRAEAGSFAINVQLGGGPYVAVPAPVAVAVPAPAAETPVAMIWNNRPAVALAGYAGTGRYFRIDVPDGQTYLNVLTTGGWGDCDLYVARGYLPTPARSDFAATGPGTEQQVTVLYPAWGSWYVLVQGAGQYGGVSLMSSFWQQSAVYCDGAAGMALPPPLGARNVRVCIAWDRLGWGRGDCGLIPFIQRELRDHHEVWHRIMQPAPVGVVRDLHAAASRVEVPAVSHVERPAPGHAQTPAATGRNIGNDRFAVSTVERPAVNPNERLVATGRNAPQERPAVVTPRAAAAGHEAAPAGEAARAERIESHSAPAPMPTLTRVAGPEYTSGRSAGTSSFSESRGRAADSGRDSASDHGTSAGGHDRK